MKLIVALGNPGREYKETHHNVGFMILDNYLGKVEYKNKMESLFYRTTINDEEVIFIKPQTYMNLSGLAVKKVVRYYKIDIKDILVIQDDVDLPIGTYKIKRNSSSGGHNGIKSIIQELGTDDFARLKVGIGKNKLMPTDKYVLSKFSTKELSKIKEDFSTYNEIIDEFIKSDIEIVMQKYNTK